MGFFSGRVSFARFKVKGKAPNGFGPEHLERLEERAIGKERTASRDGIETGWSAGGHLLDVRFDLAKNIVEDTLHFALRIDANKPPSDLLKSYTQMELDAIAAENPSGKVSQKQKREARMAAMDKLNEEAADGRYLRRKAYSLLWDGQSNELLVGTTSVSVLDRLTQLFEQTFGQKIEALSSGILAHKLAEPRGQSRAVDDAQHSTFLKGGAGNSPQWVVDDNSRDFLGNEFLVWLWNLQDEGHDTIKLEDGSEVAFMLARTLALECPKGQSGKESISSDAPTKLPEAMRALQSGKLPRKTGITLVRHDQSYDLALSAELLAVNGAKMPLAEALEDRARLEERVGQIRHLLETMDLLFDAFGKVRLAETWNKDLSRIRKWLKGNDGED